MNNIGDTGQNVRRIYQRRLPSNNNKDYYYILRDTGNTEAVIVEYGFIDNKDDVNFLKNNYKELGVPKPTRGIVWHTHPFEIEVHLK